MKADLVLRARSVFRGEDEDDLLKKRGYHKRDDENDILVCLTCDKKNCLGGDDCFRTRRKKLREEGK